MAIEIEINRLTKLYHKHGLSFGLHLEPPEEMKIILTKKFCSTYIFTFKKRKVDSFFLCTDLIIYFF